MFKESRDDQTFGAELVTWLAMGVAIVGFLMAGHG
jgi:hypothetical protein